MKMKKVGSILRKAREDKLLEYKDVAAQTKIHPRYLKALEDEDYGVFSSDVHLQGFLKAYVEYLGLNETEIVAFFRRDYALGSLDKKKKQAVTPLNMPKFLITPSLVVSSAILLLVLAFFGYLFFEYRSFAGAPLLLIESPAEEVTTINTSSVVIAGKTDPDAVVSINGQKITLGEKGLFSTPITLVDGINVLTITAENKLGKQSRESKTVVVERAKTAVTSGAEAVAEVLYEGVQLVVTVGPSAAWVEITTDGKKEFDGLLASGVTRAVKAVSVVRVLSGNAGSTAVAVNGKDVGKMGEEGAVVEKVYRAEEQGISVEDSPAEGEEVEADLAIEENIDAGTQNLETEVEVNDTLELPDSENP